MPRSRRIPSGSSRRSTPRKGAPPADTRAPRPSFGRLELLEDPHAHIVCHVCGRIQRVELNELDRHLLTELAGGRPEGWSVDRIAFSLTGACSRCREGPPAP